MRVPFKDVVKDKSENLQTLFVLYHPIPTCIPSLISLELTSWKRIRLAVLGPPINIVLTFLNLIHADES